jgi:hypothetical protein
MRELIRHLCVCCHSGHLNQMKVKVSWSHRGILVLLDEPRHILNKIYSYGPRVLTSEFVVRVSLWSSALTFSKAILLGTSRSSLSRSSPGYG